MLPHSFRSLWEQTSGRVATLFTLDLDQKAKKLWPYSLVEWDISTAPRAYAPQLKAFLSEYPSSKISFLEADLS